MTSIVHIIHTKVALKHLANTTTDLRKKPRYISIALTKLQEMARMLQASLGRPSRFKPDLRDKSQDSSYRPVISSLWPSTYVE